MALAYSGQRLRTALLTKALASVVVGCASDCTSRWITRPKPTPSMPRPSHTTFPSRSAGEAAPPSTPPHGLWVVPGRAYRVNDPETRAHSNSSWCREAPASVLSTGSLTPRKAELSRATRFSSLVAAPGHDGLIRGRRLSAVLSSLSPGRATP